MRTSTTNPQQKAINQKRGPTVGNHGNTQKRSAFTSVKASSGTEKSALAEMVTNAVANRGRGMKPHIDSSIESLHDNTGPKVNPTSNGSKLPGKYKSPKR